MSANLHLPATSSADLYSNLVVMVSGEWFTLADAEKDVIWKKESLSVRRYDGLLSYVTRQDNMQRTELPAKSLPKEDGVKLTWLLDDGLGNKIPVEGQFMADSLDLERQIAEEAEKLKKGLELDTGNLSKPLLYAMVGMGSLTVVMLVAMMRNADRNSQ